MIISRRLFVLTLLAASWVERSHAGILDSIFGGLGGGNAQGEEDSPVFYQEDKLANAAMMLEFADTPLYLVALFKWRDRAVYEDGRDTNLSGFDADKLYTQAMFSDIVPGVGGEAKLVANIDRTSNLIEGDDSSFHSDWDALAVIEFPSGRAFGRMLFNQRFQDLSPHKKAGLEYHAIFACELVPGSSVHAGQTDFGMEMAESALTLVDLVDYKRSARYRAGDEDAARFRSGRDAVKKYYEASTPQAVAHGMETAAVFKIKQNLILGAEGVDGSWDEIRINTYPSAQALEAARLDDAINKKGWQHVHAGANRMSQIEASPMFFNSLGGHAQMGYYDACSFLPRLELASEKVYDTSSYCPGVMVERRNPP